MSLNQDRVIELVEVAKRVDFTKVFKEIDRRREIHGHVHFEDIEASLSHICNRVETPHLYEACKRYLESIITVTIHGDWDVIPSNAW